MFIPNKTTILDNMFKQETAEYLSQFPIDKEITITSSAAGSEYTEGGHVIYPIDVKLKSVVDLLHFKSFCTKNDHPKLHHYEKLFNSVTSTILTIDGTHTYKEAINKILPFINKAGSNFYGAILRKDSVIINPFSVAAIIPHLDANYQEKFNIILYFYKDRKELDKYYETNESDSDLVNIMIENMLKPIGTPVSYSSKVSAIETLSEGKFKITQSTKVHIDDNFSASSAIKSENYIVAHQAVTRGVLAPFYGATILSKEPTSGASGAHITPMLCANVSSPATSAGNLTPTQNSPISFGSVCTGSQPNSTLKGLTALTQCNMLSPYNRNTIVAGALAYVDASINKCLEIYKKVGYITDYTPIITPTAVDEPFPLIAIIAYFENELADYITSNDLPLEYFNEIENYITTNNITNPNQRPE